MKNQEKKKQELEIEKQRNDMLERIVSNTELRTYGFTRDENGDLQTAWIPLNQVINVPSLMLSNTNAINAFGTELFDMSPEYLQLADHYAKTNATIQLYNMILHGITYNTHTFLVSGSKVMKALRNRERISINIRDNIYYDIHNSKILYGMLENAIVNNDLFGSYNFGESNFDEKVLETQTANIKVLVDLIYQYVVSVISNTITKCLTHTLTERYADNEINTEFLISNYPEYSEVITSESLERFVYKNYLFIISTLGYELPDFFGSAIQTIISSYVEQLVKTFYFIYNDALNDRKIPPK